MLQRIFQTILRRYFGQFLTGIQNLQLTFWSGKIHLTNISLKHQKINQILSANNIPFSVKYSHIGSLSIDIPWKSLSSAPVQIKISEVYIVLRMEKYVNVEKKIQEENLMLIKNYVQHLIKKIMEDKGEKGEGEDGYFKKMVVKILHNLNAQVKDISLRVICGNDSPITQNAVSIKMVQKKQKIIQPVDRSSFMSIDSGSQKNQPPETQRRPSETQSQFLRRNQKSFSFGFCLKQFSFSTVDQNLNKKFYNLDNKKSPVRKILQMKQISLYLEEQSVFNIFRVPQEKKIQFMREAILRQKYRLLSIDGKIMMNRNVEGNGQNQFYDYVFKMQLQFLEVKATYGQLREVIKIFANFSNASQAKQVKKLSQIPESQQLLLKAQFINNFKQLYSQNFKLSSMDLNKIMRHILISVSKKNLLLWTKQCAVEIIKTKKIESIKKQKNKKGWLNYLIAQADVDLTPQQINQVYKQIEQMAQSIDQKKIGLMVDFIFNKIAVIVSHEQLQEYLYFQLSNIKLKYQQVAKMEMHLSIQSIFLNYQNHKQRIKSYLLSGCPSQFYNNLFQFQMRKKGQQVKISLQLAQLQLNHESRVLLLISQLLKLKKRQQMKSDIKLKKAELAVNKNNYKGNDLQQSSKNYQIDVKINKITFRIQVNEISHILLGLQSIIIGTSMANKHHIGQIKNFNIAYVSVSKKQAEKQMVNKILKDFTVMFSLSSNLNKIYTKVDSLQLIICESDLHSIYRSYIKQAVLFKAEKVEQKNKDLHQYSYVRGHLKLLTIMKSWKSYQGILTDQGIFFFQQEPFDQQQQLNQQAVKPSHFIPISDCIVNIISEDQFKIQSDTVKQLIECSPEQLGRWVQFIEKIVFQNSSKAKMYKLLDQQQNESNQSLNTNKSVKIKKYETQIKIELQKLQILISESRQKSLVQLLVSKTLTLLRQNELQFQRNISIESISIKRLQNPTQSQQNYLLKNYKDEDSKPANIGVKIFGKKKLHPQYRGQIQINLHVPYIKANYDPQFLYTMIKKIAWGHQIPSYTNQMRNQKVLQFVKQFLRSSFYEKREAQLQAKDCKVLEDFNKYKDIHRYRASGHTCQVLLAVTGEINQAQFNLINGANNISVFNVKGNELNVKLDKSSQFIFFKLTAAKLSLFDVTGYPNTNTKPFKQSKPYPLLYGKSDIVQQQGVQCYFSRFDLDHFINKSRIKSFFFLNLYDMHLNFQNQLINRFFDYLFNQIIGFILAPHSLHKYDGPKRGPFLYQYSQTMTEKQIKDVIVDSFQPFFTKMFINAYNLTVTFNSFPQLQGFDLDMEALKIQSFNYQKNERIRFNTTELAKIQKYPTFKQLLKVPGFSEKLLKNHWVSRMNIIGEGIKSIIFSFELPKLQTFVQRLINSQKQLIFPFVTLDTILYCQSVTKNLSIKAPKQIYNMINKCIMHNVSYDDTYDSYFTHNWQFKSYMKVSELFYRLKSQSLEIIVPQLKSVIAIPDFQYKFIRYPSCIKQMLVEGRSINIFRGSQVIMMTSQHKDKNTNTDINGLYYRIQMKLNGEKPMQVKLSYIDIYYNLQFFLKLVQYTILDQSCYPPLPANTIISQLPDLPLITCKVGLQNSRIKLIVPGQQENQFICGGHISVLWVRNSLPHPQKYSNNPQNFPQGKQWCSYRIQLKQLTIRKRQLQKSLGYSSEVRVSNYNQSKGRYRFISNKISLVFKISQLMRLAGNQSDRYNDNVFQLKVSHIGLKLCYADIEELKSIFQGKQSSAEQQQKKMQLKESQRQKYMIEESQSEIMQPIKQQQPVQPQVNPPTYIAHTKYSIAITKFQIQLGLSELPVPLLDFVLKQTKSNIEMIGSNTNIQLKTSINANCWNMLIGRWQPIIQELSPALNCRIGKDKYILLDCNKILLFNISLQSLKILKLLSSDFSQKGKFSILKLWNKEQPNSDNKVKGMNVSPYVLCNRTGVTLQVYNQHTQSKIKLKPQQKTYIDLKNFNYEIDFAQKLKVVCQFEGSSKFQVYMDLASSKKVAIQYKKRQYPILLKPISNSIMKQIIVSSFFIIQNKTSYVMAFYYNYGYHEQDQKDIYQGRVKVMPKQKTALKFTASIKNLNTTGAQKNLKLQFPQLQKNEIQNNCQFPYEALNNGYQHRIDLLRNKTFNCIISIQEQLCSTIVVEPSFHIKNLLPLDILVEFVVQRLNDKIILPIELTVNEEKDIYDFNSKQKLQLRLKIKGFNISPLQNIVNVVNNQQQYRTQLDLIDYRGNPGKISVKIIKQNKVRRMFIYSSAVLVNQTQYDLYTFTSGKLIPGQKISDIVQSQSIYTFINATQYQTLNFGFSQDNPFNSNQVKISQLGVHNVSMYKNQQLFQFTVKCNFHCLDNYALLYSYVLKLQPRYIIVNQTSFTLEIAQHYIQNKSQFLRSKERLNWIWPVRSEPKVITLRSIQNQQYVTQWAYSAPLPITEQDIQQNVIVLRPKNNSSDKKLLKIIPIKQNQSNYFLVEQVIKTQDYLITINNELQLCKLRVYQQCTRTQQAEWANQKYFEINPNNTIPFGWDFPNQQQILCVQISFTGYLRTKFDPQTIKISLEKQKIQQIVIQNDDNESQAITIKIQIIGLRKKVTFCKRTGYQQEDSQLELMHVGNRFAFSFTEIGISVISSVKKRSELLFLSLKKLQIIIMQKQFSRSLQVKIKYINIDNNSNHNTIYPILLTPIKYEKTLKKSRPFFVLLFEQNLQNKDILQIKQLRICTEPISIKIHDQVLTAVVDMIQQIKKQAGDVSERIDLLSIFRSYYQKMQWQELNIIKPQRDIFFRQFQVAKLALQITFSIRPKLNANNFIIMTILSSFGAAISNVSEAQLTLSRFLKKDKGLNQLKAQISDFYFKQFMKGLYKVLGSINLFGNPYVFIRLVAQGAWEIVNQPTQGFIKGPIQGAIGIAKGGVYFTRNVVAGTCNSFEAISQSISRGVSYLTMDQKFIERREKIKIQKSNHFFKGLQYGAFSIYTGLQVAFTGLYRHPVQGYQANGLVGGLTGTLKGFAGLVTKPISGTFQGISKISQGIKNTALMFQDGPNSKRSRPPRLFLTQLAYYKNYNILQSTALSILQYCSTKYLNECINYISVIDDEQKKIKYAYVLAERYFSKVDIFNRKLLLQIEIEDIKQLKIQQNALYIVTNRDEIVIEDRNYHEMFQVMHKYYFHDL